MNDITNYTILSSNSTSELSAQICSFLDKKKGWVLQGQFYVSVNDNGKSVFHQTLVQPERDNL